MPDLYAIVIRLYPSEHFTYHLGKSLHTWFFKQLENKAPMLSYTGDSDYRLFTLGLFFDQDLPLIRLTALRSDATDYLLEFVHKLNGRIDIGENTFLVQDIITDNTMHPHTGSNTYTELIAEARNQKIQHKLRFEVVSPICFRKSGSDYPIPQPDLFFGSLLRRWQNLTAEDFLFPLDDYIQNHLYISGYDLRTVYRHVPTSTPGFIGKLSFNINRPPNLKQKKLLDWKYQAQLVSVLARFSFYSGTGAKTSYGMGQLRFQD